MPTHDDGMEAIRIADARAQRDFSYLCFAWGESDLPVALVATTRDAVLKFLVDEWFGEQPEKMGEANRADWDDAVARFDAHDWREEGPLKWTFEIGGVEITKVSNPATPTDADARAAGGSDNNTPIDEIYLQLGEVIPGSSLEAAIYHADEAYRSLEKRLREAEALVKGLGEQSRVDASISTDAIARWMKGFHEQRERAERAEAALADMKMQRDDLMSACTKENTRAEEAENRGGSTVNRELVERLREAAGMQDYDMGNGDWLSELLAEAASALEASAPEWISVGDRLPKVGEVVMVAGLHSMMTMAMRHEWTSLKASDFFAWLADDEDWSDCITSKVTHWMPLPAAPKGKP